MTDAERTLWHALRDRQISGVKFRRQHPFNDHILDFVSLKIKLVVEVDGSQHGEKQRLHDAARTRDLEAAGFHVLRFWNNEVLQNLEAVKEKIWMKVRELRKATPSPPPPSP